MIAENFSGEVKEIEARIWKIKKIIKFVYVKTRQREDDSIKTGTKNKAKARLCISLSPLSLSFKEMEVFCLLLFKQTVVVVVIWSSTPNLGPGVISKLKYHLGHVNVPEDLMMYLSILKSIL